MPKAVEGRACRVLFLGVNKSAVVGSRTHWGVSLCLVKISFGNVFVFGLNCPFYNVIALDGALSIMSLCSSVEN